jgi:hypothetical protein
MLPSDERAVGFALHVRYQNGDPIARAEIFIRYHDLLVDDLRSLIARQRLFVRGDDIQIVAENAALKALASYLERPEQYQPARGKTLGGYLRMSARGDFKNDFAAAVARARALAVGFDADDWNELADDADAVATIEDDVDATALRDRCAGVPDTEEERVVIGFMLDGERSNEALARTLGWPTPFTREQATAINKIKDRLNKRIKRRFAEG